MPGGSQFPGVQIEGSGLDTELRPTRSCLDPESAGRWGGQAGDGSQVIWATVRPREKGGPGPGRAGRGDTAQDRVTVDAEDREASVGGPGALRWRGPGWRRPRQGARAGPLPETERLACCADPAELVPGRGVEGALVSGW